MTASRGVTKQAGVLLLALAIFAAAGCRKTIDTLTFSEPEEPTRLIDKYAVPPAQNATAEPPPDFPRKGLLGQRMKYGVMSCPVMEERLNAILDRIEAVWPGEPHPATAFIIPTRGFQAYSTEDGGIFLSYSMLRDITSENEAAAVLAHEYSHVVLGHHKLSHAEILFRAVYNFGSMYVSAKYNLKKGDVKGLLAEAGANELLLEAGQSALLPIFSRDQEGDADLLGTDLMVAAGYDPRGMSGFLQLLEASEKQEPSPEAKAAGLTDIQGKPGKQQPKSLSEGLDAAVSEVGSQLASAYRQMSRKHGSTQERDAAVHAYVETFYEDVNRDVDNAEAWTALLRSPEVTREFALVDEVKTAVEIKQDDEGKAMKIIAGLKDPSGYAAVPYCRYTVLGLKSIQMKGDVFMASLRRSAAAPDSLLGEHTRLIAVLEEKSPSDALQAAMQADEEFGHPLDLLPTLIRLNKKSKNDVMVAGYLVKCLSAGDKDLVRECHAAAGKKQ